MKKWLLVASLMLALVLVGCGAKTPEEEVSHDDMEGMDHTNGGKLPDGLQQAKNPTYPVGTEVILHTDHMEGMNGATAKVVGAFDTTVYAVNYTPTDGGAKVMDHKWVIHEELEKPAAAPLAEGTEVTIAANHMKGMEGAIGDIASAKQTTVYIVNYEPTTGGDEVKDHKWVTEDELSKK